jgi:predicted permease
MLQIYLDLLPLFLLILAGMALKFFGIIKKQDASLFLKLVFYLTMPALVITNIPNTNITTDFIFLPAIPVIIGAILFFISRFIGKQFNLEKKTLGVFVISSIIMNTALIFAFVSIIYGNDGIARILVLDAGNVLMIFGFAYFQACKYGNHGISNKQLLKRFLGAVPAWALLVASVMNMIGFKLEGPVYEFAKITGDLTIPLLLISVGIFFEPKIVHIKANVTAVAIRIGFGGIIGLIIVNLLDLQGITRDISILSAAAPVGYNTLTFSSIENLDKEFAAGLVSSTILLALAYVPLIIYFLEY